MRSIEVVILFPGAHLSRLGRLINLSSSHPHIPEPVRSEAGHRSGLFRGDGGSNWKANAIMNFVISEPIQLTEFRPSDKLALIEHLREKEIYDRTLRIPYPYTEADAGEWLGVVANATRQQRQPIHWAIRNAEEYLIGGIGFDGLAIGKSHRAEIGYWLAKPFWRQGIMTAVVQHACQYAFEKFDLIKITAHVFATNPASSRVLEKCGFEQEGYLRKHYLKDGKCLDAKSYARLR